MVVQLLKKKMKGCQNFIWSGKNILHCVTRSTTGLPNLKRCQSRNEDSPHCSIEQILGQKVSSSSKGNTTAEGMLNHHKYDSTTLKG